MSRLIAATCFVVALAALPSAQDQPHTATPPAKTARQSQAKPAVMVNLNTASATELAELPGVGAKTAARIIDYRQKKGPFKKPEELMNVQGIGEKSFLKLKSQISVTGKPDAVASQQN